VQVDTQTNLINAVWFYPNESIPLGEIIDKFGEPNYIILDQDAAPRTIHPRFYWDSIRMPIAFPEIGGVTYDIKTTSVVKAIQFSDENLYRTSDMTSDPYYKTWDGYGIYQLPTAT
jgi:hypothetical protein